MSASELIALAEQEGLTLTAGHIYNIRSKSKKQGDTPADPVASDGAPKRGDAALEAQLRTLVIRIGLDRAKRVFTELEASLARFG